MMLLAQGAPDSMGLVWSGAVVGVAFIAFLTIAAVAGIWQERRKSEIKHIETLKRLEMGLADTPADKSWPQALVCVAIGFGVPVVAFGATLIGYLNKEHVPEEIWIAPGVVSIVSVVMSSGTALKLFSTGASDREVTRDPASAPKLVSDPDAFDVAGRRG
jgi:hypothetical protein